MRTFHAFQLDHDIIDALQKVDARTPGVTESQLLVHPLDFEKRRVTGWYTYEAKADPAVQRGHFYIEILEVVVKE